MPMAKHLAVAVAVVPVGTDCGSHGQPLRSSFNPNREKMSKKDTGEFRVPSGSLPVSLSV